MAWLVAGLGNPGDRYANTRHNLGRMVVDELARDDRERFEGSVPPGELSEIRVAGEERPAGQVHPVHERVRALVRGRRQEARDRALQRDAVHDELDIAAGTLKVKLGGGTRRTQRLRSLQRAAHQGLPQGAGGDRWSTGSPGSRRIRLDPIPSASTRKSRC